MHCLSLPQLHVLSLEHPVVRLVSLLALADPPQPLPALALVQPHNASLALCGLAGEEEAEATAALPWRAALEWARDIVVRRHLFDRSFSYATNSPNDCPHYVHCHDCPPWCLCCFCLLLPPPLLLLSPPPPTQSQRRQHTAGRG